MAELLYVSMHNSFIYPIDTDKFDEIRGQGKLYVDKTDMIYDIVKVKMYKYVFMARPRRFGKSLLCNTLHAYFEGRKELFDGLKIAELEKDWVKYPVLHFDMSAMLNCKTIAEMREVLEKMLSDYENLYGIKKDVNEIGARFGSLLCRVKEKTGLAVVVLIDEYDTPMMRNLYNEEMKENVRTLMKAFYQRLKIDGSYLRFVFLAGITKFSQMSIFSELNNLNQISMADEYSGLCGITQEELDTVLHPCVEDFAKAQECSVEEAYAMLKKQYDGYHFSENSHDVYAPFSLLKAFNDRKLKEYWFESGTSSSLIEHLKHFPKFNPLEFDGIRVMEDEFNTPCEDADSPIPLLYQSGYLSIDTYNKRMKSYILHFPNFEVRNGIIKSLAPIVLKRDKSDNNA